MTLKFMILKYFQKIIISTAYSDLKNSKVNLNN